MSGMLMRLRLVSLICVVLLLAGCGGEGGNGDPADADGDPAPATESEDGDDDGAGAADPEDQAEPEAVTYEVQEGDNLTSIAAQFDTTVDAIVEENDLDDPDAIVAGEELTIPAAQASADDDADPGDASEETADHEEDSDA